VKPEAKADPDLMILSSEEGKKIVIPLPYSSTSLFD